MNSKNVTVTCDLKTLLCLDHEELKDVPLAGFMYLVFTCMPGESDRRRFRPLWVFFFFYICRGLIIPFSSLLFASKRFSAITLSFDQYLARR